MTLRNVLRGVLWSRRRAGALLSALLLALAFSALVGLLPPAAAAALKQPSAPVGASGTGVNAPPAGSQPLYPGKWDAQNYRIPHPAASCPQPPAAAADRLALVNSVTLLGYYGLPNPRFFAGRMDAWRDIVTHSAGRICDSSTPVENGQLVTNTYYLSGNGQWGGYANYCSYCASYLEADAKFTVPSISTSAYVKDSIWVGIGGYVNAEALAQTGVRQQSIAYINSNTPFYESEGCGVKGEQDWSYSPNTNDSMYASADIYGDEYLDDYTQGKYMSAIRGCGTSDIVENIVERLFGQSGPPLAHFANFTWHNAEFYDVNYSSHNMTDFGPWFFQLKGSGGNLLMNSYGYGYDSYGNNYTYDWLAGS